MEPPVQRWSESPAGTSRVLEALPTAVLIVDPGGRIDFANPRAEQILGFARLAGRPIAESLAPLEVLRRATGEAHERPLLQPPGRPGLTLGLRAAPVTLDARPGHEPHLVVLFQDITPVERLREERDRLLRLAAVGEVLPAVLHEIKNPLAAVTTSVEVLLEELPDGHARRELVAVLGEVRRIKLALEGIGIFRNELRTARRTAVDAALREAFLVTDRQMKAKGIAGALRMPTLPLLPFDPAVLRAILFNLVTNAIHACSAGNQVRVEAAVSDGLLELSVADDGCGMTPEVLARCREIFFTTKANGSGIGLALCNSVVEGAGGELQIESEPGRGTLVRMRVPVEGAATVPAEA